ncbi:hypothetical protein LVV83_15720 [Pseudomonas sp. LM20]|uniref:hypothetical protein n=1 Tax=Pseudomonas sp. LM20 TaxID=2899116 RepID=UPI001F367C60|nr:hypothetical protein [Pseudomonas sp. LM20]MCE5988480.1 hypothetical protein [Pseudomonas sp. LM20]
MKTNRISAEHTAKLLLINLAEYSEAKGRELARFRISRDSLKRVSNRKTLREAFVFEVIDEMAQLGWSAIDTGTMESDNVLAFIMTSKIDAWPRLGVLRVLELARMKADLEDVHDAIDEAYDEHYPELEDDVLALED